MQNYFNYFTEVEERFQQRRGSLLLLSTLDWTLIESWREAEIPLAAVLRGIDDAFNKYDARKSKSRVRRVNGLAWCQQSVMEAAEQMREAAAGSLRDSNTPMDAGFGGERIAAHLARVAQSLSAAPGLPPEAARLAKDTSDRLQELMPGAQSGALTTEELEHTLRTLEERLLAILTATAPEDELSALRAQAAREIAPHRGRMQALQIRQIVQQLLEKRLLEKYAVPRLSLFYMRDDAA